MRQLYASIPWNQAHSALISHVVTTNVNANCSGPNLLILLCFAGPRRGTSVGCFAWQAEGWDSDSRAPGHFAASSHLPRLRARPTGGARAKAASTGENGLRVSEDALSFRALSLHRAPSASVENRTASYTADILGDSRPLCLQLLKLTNNPY
jgi:hypothetical protein